MIPKWLEMNPEKSKVAAGLACGNLWTVVRGMVESDIVLCPMGKRNYAVGEVQSGYIFQPEKALPHRRNVQWKTMVTKDSMSEGLQKMINEFVVLLFPSRTISASAEHSVSHKISISCSTK